MDVKQFKDQLATTAFAFRGYNITNLGRSGELLAHPRYGATVRDCLREAAKTHADVTGRKSDLIHRVRRGHETTLKTYSHAIALIVAMEIAQLRLLDEFFGIHYKSAKMGFGYSLGEIAALIAGGSLDMSQGLQIPLSLADDCAALAADATLGILFSRGHELPTHEVRELCMRINSEDRGMIDISAYLSPNSLLLMGEGDTLDRFKRRMADEIGEPLHLRKNDHRWPPMHTSLVWRKSISNRAGLLLNLVQGTLKAPQPPVFSLVTGTIAYDDYNIRDLLCRWSDQPQRLWDAVYHILGSNITRVVHVGPQPNIIPATFTRLSENVIAQTKNSFGARALLVARPWLKAILPARTALLRAPQIEQIILEDWLLAQK